MLTKKVAGDGKSRVWFCQTGHCGTFHSECRIQCLVDKLDSHNFSMAITVLSGRESSSSIGAKGSVMSLDMMLTFPTQGSRMQLLEHRLNLPCLKDNEEIRLPEISLVLLVGASSSGKSTFAKKYFASTEVLSSDCCRALVSDDENNQMRPVA